ncbi:MAG: MBL fold metallo-hydrolase [Rhodospirillaceae bacterium]|jgi:phosphoribosyl 1,2-cyclic phosphodiesterase|nr:MBL fold metallo-hydrolase [Rhodospirillaceae bacterium]MBT5013602.1 MBL fold metallo-hydrolase [Rhodospirillaceae bacterium]MBT7355375.1 MBL fold metallo-hydrolase [Rhodospirillaceae bacterium]
MTFDIRFWGVRGSIACPSTEHIKYGGNTSCIEVSVGDRIFVLDAGTGIRGLGQEFLKRDVREAHLLLTHTHWDHINGFPFFVPAYDPKRAIHIMAGHLNEREGGIQGALSAQMDSPMFPVPLEAMQAKLRFEDFKAGDSFDLYDDVHVRTAALNHPNGATGYRIEYEGKSVCYITDTEHVAGELDQNILGLIEGSDLVIYDSMYTEEEYETKVGWGHSTWNEGVKLCREANAKKLAIFHHEPEHTDDIMDGIEVEAQKEWASCFVAREGVTVELD